MGLTLPGPVDDFLSFIGIDFPNIDEDKVREFGEHVDQFAQNLNQTVGDAGQTIKDLGQAYQGHAYEQLFARWGELSNSHMKDLVEACHVIREACDVAYGVIIGMKTEAIAELVVMAANFIAAQAEAFVTFGASEAEAALIEVAGRELVKFLKQELISYIENEIINAALNPLIEKVTQAVSGLAYKEVASALDVPATGTAPQFTIQPSAVFGLAQKLHGHGDEVQAHYSSFSGSVSGMDFS